MSALQQAKAVLDRYDWLSQDDWRLRDFTEAVSDLIRALEDLIDEAEETE